MTWQRRRLTNDSGAYSATYYFLIAGQSNASGRGALSNVEAPSPYVLLYGNDYVLRTAAEPIDSATGQLDAVSDDGASAAHSFGLAAAKGLLVPGRLPVRSVLIPSAKGGTAMSAWQPAVDRSDRATLYGSAHYRSDQAAPAGLTAIWYYGHESDSFSDELVAGYVAAWAALMADFRSDLGASLPIVYCQLAHHTDIAYAPRMHQVAELQRQAETGSGHANELTDMHMVVTFDLPLIDNIHLNDVAQRTLGARIAMATRQHVLGESVDGTGPRPNGAPTHPGGDKNKIKIDTTQTLATISGNADNQFRVFDDGVEMTISSVVNDADASAILITMSAPASGVVTVSYGDVVASAAGVTLSNVIKNAAGLPLPQFGLQTVA